MSDKLLIAGKISVIVNSDIETILRLIEIPPKPELGDFAFPCFQLAKTLHKSPNIIANEIKCSLDNEEFEKIEVMGGYVNLFLNKSKLSNEVISKILKQKDTYGDSLIGKGKNITIDYSSPNIAKPFHIGHLSTTVIGNSLYRIFKSQGYNAIGINHLGDWGTQFGKLIYAYNRWVDKDLLEKQPIKELLRIYVKFHEEAEKDPVLEDLARKHFKNLEDGCPEEIALWQKMKNLSLKEFKTVYEKLGVEFDSYTGESFYNDKMDLVIEELQTKDLLIESNGALVVNLDSYNMPPCIIKKSDGATIYATRDLAAAIYRKKTYNFYKNIYVVGTPQALHFKQVFTTLKLMGKNWSDDCIHVGFGLVKFEDKKLATRKGDVIFLDDLLNEATQRALNLINEKNSLLEDKKNVSEKVGIGAVIFAYLKNNRERDIIFNWNDMLNFDGETGPYVQYTYARGKSILRKASDLYNSSCPDYSKMNTQEEYELCKALNNFSNAITLSMEKYEPSILTRYLIDVAKYFNKFYNLHPILSCEDESLKVARLNLVESTTIVIKKGLYLIGIQTVEKM